MIMPQRYTVRHRVKSRHVEVKHPPHRDDEYDCKKHCNRVPDKHSCGHLLLLFLLLIGFR